MFIPSWIFRPQEIWAIFLLLCCYWYQCLWNCGWLDYFWIWHIATVFPVNVLLSFQSCLLQRSWAFLADFWFSKGLLLCLSKTSLRSRKCSAFLSIAESVIAKVAVISYIRGIVIYLMIAPQDFPWPSCSGCFHVPPQDLFSNGSEKWWKLQSITFPNEDGNKYVFLWSSSKFCNSFLHFHHSVTMSCGKASSHFRILPHIICKIFNPFRRNGAPKSSRS